MAKGVRLSETWFNRALWLIAFIFAGFLIGLGNLVVNDLPRVEAALSTETYIDRPAANTIRKQLQIIAEQRKANLADMETTRAKVETATKAFDSERQTLANWIETRKATGLSDQNGEVLRRTHALDDLKDNQKKAQSKYEAYQQIDADFEKQSNVQQDQLNKLQAVAQEKYDVQLRKQELRVFLYRLLLTLPLLILAGWLLAKHRKNRYWPFVWGFAFFALFAFFFELVPYLPSYGGYVRYIVGIVVTVIAGRYAINGLQKYLERQKAEEQKPDVKRREELNYDLALNRLSKKVCPGCERPIDVTDTERNFCTHCGICVFDHCGTCKTRKGAFTRFCHSCGATAQIGLAS